MMDCFNALDTFGKTPDQLKSVIKMHLLVMEEFPMQLIKDAYLKWVKTESKMPCPADIANLIREEEIKKRSKSNRIAL